MKQEIKEREIVYLPHPVSAADKAEYTAAGYKIVDVAHKPKEDTPIEDASGMKAAFDAVDTSAAIEPAQKRRGRPTKI